jgi:hypothetical protein
MRDMMAQIRDVGDGIRGGTYTMTAPVITGGSITGVALSGNTLTNPVITGGSINNTTVGATTRSTGAFTTLASNGATTFTAGTASTSTTTGTAVITGGLGVSGRINAANFDGIVGANTAAAGNFTTLGASSTATLNTLASSGATITGGSLDNTPIGATTASTGSFTSLTDSGNLTFTGTGNRITGDFSNATVSSRVAFQTSTATSPTYLNIIPNGARRSDLYVFDNSDPTNASYLALSARGLGGTVNLEAGITGTGTYLPLVMNTGGSERLRIDTSGNVGIGTSSPPYQFSVSNGTSTVGFTPQSTIAYAGTHSNHPFGFLTNNTERMRIDSSGLVGIGTSSPSTFGARLNVQTASTTGYALITQAPVSGGTIGNTSNMVYFLDGRGSSNDGFKFYSRRFATAGQWENQTMRIERIVDSVQSCGIIEFGPTTLDFYANNSVKVMTITSSNVGIGTSSPSARLHVSGATSLTSRMIFSDTANSKQLDVGADANGGFSAVDGVNSYLIYTNTTERLRVDGSGNVGIGTSSPAQKLDVSSSGQTRIQATSTGTSLYPGFVVKSGSALTFEFTQFSDGTGYIFNGANSPITFSTNSTERMRIHSSGGVSIGNTTDRGAGNLNVTGVVLTGGYTVATLPAGVVGMRAYVTDALAPSFGVTVAGSGAVTIPVFYNGANWIVA